MVIDFVLDHDKKITIIVPDLPEKINYFYPESNSLHRFDEAAVFWILNNKKIEIKIDCIDEILCNFYRCLKKAINYELHLTDCIDFGKIGQKLNVYLNDLSKEKVSLYWMWSGNKNESAMLYNFNNKIYLEIVPIYLWTFRDPKPHEQYISFEEFMTTYKPYAVQEIPLAVAIAWKDQAEKLLREINSACLA